MAFVMKWGFNKGGGLLKIITFEKLKQITFLHNTWNFLYIVPMNNVSGSIEALRH